MIQLNQDQRFCYFVLESRRHPGGGLVALVAKEGERGYYHTDWNWGEDIDKAETTAEFKNALLGIDKKEAMLIVLSTMRHVVK